MKIHIILLLFALSLVIFTVSSCSQSLPEIELDLKSYTLVRSDYADKAPLDAFVELRKGLNEKGTEVEVKTDFLVKSKNEQPGELELLFGYTERAESETALTEYPSLGHTEFLVKLYGKKLVVLAGSDNAYHAAAEWLLERYDSSDGTLSVPEAPYLGAWIPALEGLTIDGVPIDRYRIVADDILGWKLAESAQMLRERLGELCGIDIPVVSDESELGEHEILLCSDYANRTLPDGDGAFIADGNLYLNADTKAEFDALFARFTEKLLTEASSKEITAASLSVCKAPEYRTELISVKGNDPDSRGEALRAAFEKAGTLLKASTDAPIEVTIELADGEYRLTEPIYIENTEFSRLTVRAEKGAEPIITGAVDIPDSAWTRVEGEEYYCAKLDCDVRVRDLFVENRSIPLAGGSKFVTIADFDNPKDKKDPVNDKGLYLHLDAVNEIEEFASPTELILYYEWQFYTLQVAGVDLNDTKEIDGQKLVRVKFEESQMTEFPELSSNALLLPKHDYRFENNLSLITEGTCVCDYGDNTVYYYPESGTPTGVSYSVLDTLIGFENAKNICFEGIGFAGTACTVTAEMGYFSGQANVESRLGTLECAALLFDNCTNVYITDCTFEEIGTNGVQTVNQQNGLRVENCIFDDISMSALRLGNNNVKWETGDSNYGFVINNNRIENVGMKYPSSTAIFISHVDGARITHNTIHNTSYTGISCGWGWLTNENNQPYGKKINLRHVELAYNRITDIHRLLHDGGAIYVLGPNCEVGYTELFNEMHHNYSEYEPTDSRFKTGYYLDGSSSNWYVHDNVTSGPVYPLYTQYNVKLQNTHNVLSERIYSTEKISMQNNAPDRNVLFDQSDALVADTLEALFEKYPQAKAIFEDSGARLEG